MLGLVPPVAEGQDRPASDPKEFARKGQPGPEHAALHGFVGTWVLTAEGAKAKGSAEIKPILGGRFITEEVKLPFGGFSMEWLGVYGYDRQKKKYTAVWVDNMDTTTESGEGDADAAGKVLTFQGQHVDPRTGKLAAFTWRIARESEKRMTIEMFEVGPNGTPHKMLTVRGERVN
jgi:hypothetical protein